MNKSWIVYLLCCSDGRIYTGVTNNLEKRLEAHNKGNASKFTRARLPVRCFSVGI
jgi:putative endonuclease